MMSLTAADCRLVHEEYDEDSHVCWRFFQEKRRGLYKKMQHTGYLRHLLLREGGYHRRDPGKPGDYFTGRARSSAAH